MSKIYTKAELFGKKMTLAELQGIATGLGMAYEPADSREAIANNILKFQHNEELMKPVGVTEDELVKANQEAAKDELVKANQEAAKSGPVDGGEMGNAVKAGPVDAPTTPNAGLEAKDKPVDPSEGIPSFVMDAIEKELNKRWDADWDALVTRVRELEGKVRTLEASARDKGTLHGHVDNLGTIDNLKSA